MVRFVVGPDGSVVPDIAAKLPGRGYWVSATRDAIEKAVTHKHFIKAAARRVKEAALEQAKKSKQPVEAAIVKVDPALADLVEQLLRKSCLGLLGFARRAGEIITGFEKVKEVLRGKSGAFLLQASDASADGAEKLQRMASAIDLAVDSDSVEINIFTRDELSLALGRENVVHAALLPGGIRDKLLVEIDRLSGLMQVVTPTTLVKAKKV